MNHKAGYVTIIGKPNAGKSTLLNVILGQKISIVTDKPQTTRKTILGILSEDDYQMIFLDTPGILEPKYLLQEKMMEFVKRSLEDPDVIIYIFDVTDESKYLALKQMIYEELESLRITTDKMNSKLILVLNKIDLSNEVKLKRLADATKDMDVFAKIIPISALVKFNIETLKETIIELLPEHPKYFPGDISSDSNERFFVSEIVREKIFEQFREEIPYSCEVTVEDFKERENGKDYISIVIYVEKESQKKILIGKGGVAIKNIGAQARKGIEAFLGREVFLELRVKVKENWRSNEASMKSFGYYTPKD